MTAMSRREYAGHRGVTRAAVEMWIARRHLSPPALRSDGLIDAELADAQLVRELDLARHLGQGAPGSFVEGGAGSVARAEANTPDDLAAMRQIQRARANSAMVDVERKRRELHAERGKYLLARQVETEWTRTIASFVQAVEQSFPALVTSAGLHHQQFIAAKRWWRDQR